MAGPFEKAPTFGEYLNKMRETTSLDYKSGHIPPKAVFTHIHDEDGTKIANLTIPFDERLTPTTIWRLDKLLNIDSGYGKTPPAD